MVTDSPPPRRKWHLNRWLIVLIVTALSWSGWRAYTFRDALWQAKALGWYLEYTDPVEAIRHNWKAAFAKETWLGGDEVTRMDIPTSEAFEQNLAIVYRLNPRDLTIGNAATLRDMSALKPLIRLRVVYLNGCTALTNVDGLSNLSALEFVSLTGCTGLTDVDALRNLSVLQWIRLEGCTGLTLESVAALRAALPNAEISGP